MGKNPNAKKLKERKHRERAYSQDLDELQEEAARLGITIYELEEQRARERREAGIPSSEEESGSEEEQPKK